MTDVQLAVLGTGLVLLFSYLLSTPSPLFGIIDGLLLRPLDAGAEKYGRKPPLPAAPLACPNTICTSRCVLPFGCSAESLESPLEVTQTRLVQALGSGRHQPEGRTDAGERHVRHSVSLAASPLASSYLPRPIATHSIFGLLLPPSSQAHVDDRSESEASEASEASVLCVES